MTDTITTAIAERPCNRILAVLVDCQLFDDMRMTVEALESGARDLQRSLDAGPKRLGRLNTQVDWLRDLVDELDCDLDAIRGAAAK